MRESFPQCDYIEKQFTKIRPTEMLNDLHRKKPECQKMAEMKNKIDLF